VSFYRDNKKLELLQYAYVIIFAVVMVISGLIALINQAIGISFLIIPLICVVSFCMNLIAWSIIKTAIEHFHPDILKKDEKKAKKKEKQSKK